jgi:hypothetical protein
MRRFILQPAVLISASLALLAGVRADESVAPPVDDPQVSVELLVQMLGDERFAKRERATSRLVEIGSTAKEALRQGTQHPDREIRYRCLRILALVEENDFQRRLAAFATGQDEEHGLPGWQRYHEQFGGQAESRAMFVEMQRAEPDLMKSIEAGTQAVGKTLEARCLEIQQRQPFTREPVSLGSIVAMLFAVSDQQVRVPQTTGAVLATLCYQPEIHNAMHDAGRRPIVRRLLGDWINRNDNWAVFQNLALAMRYEMKEGLAAARQLIENPGNQPYVRQNAVLAIVKLGSRSDIPLLETLLEDESRCAIQKIQDKTYETQLRDVALAAILLIKGKDPKQFGFDRIQRHEVNVLVTGSVGFVSNEDRMEARQKFQKACAEEEEREDAVPSPP